MIDKKKEKDAFFSHAPEIEKKIGYKFRDRSLLMQAFTRTSYCNEHRGEGGVEYHSNEVLEFFGDGVLSASIISIFMKDLAQRYEYGIRTELGEGDFSNIRSKLSDKKNLSERIAELGLYKFLRMGEGDKKLSIELEPSVREDLFESIVGAVYIDSDMDIRTVISVVGKMLDVRKMIGADKENGAPIQSYKNALQEWCADKRRRLPAPVYKTVSESGPDHKKTYEQACYIGDRLVAVGVGKNRKLADSDAAQKALALLMSEAGVSAEKNKNGVKKSHGATETLKEADKKAVKIQQKTHISSKPESKQSDKSVKVYKRGEVDSESVTRLKEYSKSKKLSSPTFRDLGEAEFSTLENRAYSVLCKLGEREKIALAEDKSTARCAAAELLLSSLRAETAAETKKRKKKVKRESTGGERNAESPSRTVKIHKGTNTKKKSIRKFFKSGGEKL